jgi:hypothetical protein
LNIPRRFGSNGLMLRQKLLNAPARLLLLTFVLSTRMAVGTPASTSLLAPTAAHGQRPAMATRSRARQPLGEMDAYTLLHGIPRWGLNE